MQKHFWTLTSRCAHFSHLKSAQGKAQILWPKPECSSQTNEPRNQKIKARFNAPSTTFSCTDCHICLERGRWDLDEISNACTAILANGSPPACQLQRPCNHCQQLSWVCRHSCRYTDMCSWCSSDTCPEQGGLPCRVPVIPKHAEMQRLVAFKSPKFLKQCK